MPDEAFKPLGIISIAAVFATTTLIMKLWPKGTKATSISAHAGAQKTSYVLFASAVTVFGAAFYAFMWRWFGPSIGAGWLFYVILMLGAVLQLLTAWIPEDGTGGRLAKLHNKVAMNMARMMLVLVGYTALAPHVSTFGRFVSVNVFLLMAVFWYLFYFVSTTRRHFLVYQNAYIIVFYIQVLAVTYLPG